MCPSRASTNHKVITPASPSTLRAEHLGYLDAANLSIALDHYAELAYIKKRPLPPRQEAGMVHALVQALTPEVR